MLMDLADQNKKLADEVARLRQNQDAMAGRMNQPPPPAPPAPPTTEEVATAVTDALAKKQLPKFQLLGLNVGPNSDGNASFTGKGRYFAPFGNNYAFQSEGEYFYSKGQREGQFDFGLVDRINRFQAGLFGSFKHVNLTGDQTGGTLGQGALTMEYLFKWGKIGVFGTKAFLDDALVNSANVVTPSGALLNNLFIERYLRVVDQAGMSGTFGLFGKNYAEGNLGYLRSTTAGDRVGGTLRLIFPVSNKIAFTLEGGMNETLLGPGNNGRVVAGVQFGNTLRPRDYLESKHPVPVQIPRLRYEVLTRTVRKGNAAPVADAGPNQILPGAATVTLNGSASYDPDGDPITFQWVQESGPPVTLSAPTAKTTTFPAATGQNYSFRLTVKDPYGAQGIARVSITAGTPASSAPLIVSFTANPTTINAGQSSTLSWQVSNADTVSISTLGSVALSGSQAVTPATTTTYILTATHGSQTATAQATVTVNSGGGLPVIVSAESRNHRLRAELVASMGGAKRHHSDHRQLHRDRWPYRLALDFAGGNHYLYDHGDKRRRDRHGQDYADGDYFGADPLVYRYPFEYFVRGHIYSGMRDQGCGIRERERGRIHNSHGGGIGARDYHDYLQLHGDGGERADSFGANYSDRGRADRSVATEEVSGQRTGQVR
jgi:hypothetical protein